MPQTDSVIKNFIKYFHILIKVNNLFIKFYIQNNLSCIMIIINYLLKFQFLKWKWSKSHVMSDSLQLYTVHGIFPARILEWVAFLFSRDLPDPGIELGSLALQANSLPTELPGKPQERTGWETYTVVGCPRVNCSVSWNLAQGAATARRLGGHPEHSVLVEK